MDLRADRAQTPFEIREEMHWNTFTDIHIVRIAFMFFLRYKIHLMATAANV